MNPPPTADHPHEFSSIERDRWMFGKGVTLLMYHKIAPPMAGTNIPALYVHPRQFARQMDELASQGGKCVPFGDVVAVANAGGSGFCLTFDDGFCNAFEHALPVLVTRGLQSIQFLVGSQIGGTDKWDHAIGEPPQRLMDDVQVREWLAAGQAIGAHTMTHPRLAEIPLADARREIFDSKKVLEDRFGVAVDHFCYPYGSFNGAIRDLVAEAGYKAACSVEFGAAYHTSHPLQLPRVMATDLPSMWHTVAKKLLQHMSSFRKS